MAEKRGLGRGFESLIPTQIVEEEFDVTAQVDTKTGERRSGDTLREVDVNLIDPNPYQPRTEFNQEELEALAASIRIHGILQPLVGTPKGERVELIAGERRLRASRLAGLMLVPVIVRSFDEQQKLELALLENLQRSNLNPIEIATAYRKLIDQFGMSPEKIGKQIGKDRSTVANTLRLLNLPIEAKRAVVKGKITEGHARIVLTIEPEKQLEFLQLIIKHDWTTRKTEEFARAFRGKGGTKEKAQARIADYNDLTRSLGDYLGTKVSQVMTANGGKIIIEYYSDEELDRIYQAIRRQ
jgi:ParB family transcriptional regulator, chromosome partitioning protein